MIFKMWIGGLLLLLVVWFAGRERKYGEQAVFVVWVLLMLVSGAIGYFDWELNSAISRFGNTVMTMSPFLLPGLFVLIAMRKENRMPRWGIVCMVGPLGFVSFWIVYMILSITAQVGK
jgi:peptidoglycan/LPS O-acetylase OafA/YrhL